MAFDNNHATAVGTPGIPAGLTAYATATATTTIAPMGIGAVGLALGITITKPLSGSLTVTVGAASALTFPTACPAGSWSLWSTQFSQAKPLLITKTNAGDDGNVLVAYQDTSVLTA